MNKNFLALLGRKAKIERTILVFDVLSIHMLEVAHHSNESNDWNQNIDHKCDYSCIILYFKAWNTEFKLVVQGYEKAKNYHHEAFFDGGIL